MPPATGYVVHERDVAAGVDGDIASVRVTIDASVGCERLEQRVLRFAPGVSEPRSVRGAQELLYVAAGEGTLRLGGAEHRLPRMVQMGGNSIRKTPLGE